MYEWIASKLCVTDAVNWFVDCVYELYDALISSKLSILISWVDAVPSNKSVLLSNDALITAIYSLTAYWVGTVSSPVIPSAFNKVVLLLTSFNTTPTPIPFLLNGPIALNPDKLN